MITIIGAGSWGTCVASVLSAAGNEVVLWSRSGELADEINKRRVNPRYLTDLVLSERLSATSDLGVAIRGAQIVFVAVPLVGIRSVLVDVAELVSDDQTWVSLAKGIENESLLRPTEIIKQVCRVEKVAVLSGPNLASEIAAGMPCAAVVASDSESCAQLVQATFKGSVIRLYTSDDPIGVEIAGAVKNVLALASGMTDGLGFGFNSKAALLTRGIAEMTRLGTAIGGHAESFVGLAGVGDLMATCSSSSSRNHIVGMRLAKGESLSAVLNSLGMVAEGVATAPAVLALARKHNIEMPISAEVLKVLRGESDLSEAMQTLLGRSLRAERNGSR